MGHDVVKDLGIASFCLRGSFRIFGGSHNVGGVFQCLETATGRPESLLDKHTAGGVEGGLELLRSKNAGSLVGDTTGTGFETTGEDPQQGRLAHSVVTN